MRIDYLADHPDLIGQVARLHEEQWGHLRPEETLEQRTDRLRAACGRGGVPSVFVGVEEGELRGSAMLVASDMSTRPDLTPWLAGVYVVGANRGHGWGSALVRHVERAAASLGVARLYLYTPDVADFYGRLGWSADEACAYLGASVIVMSKRLG